MLASVTLFAALLVPSYHAQPEELSPQKALSKLSFLTASYEGTTTFTLGGGEIKAPTTTKGEAAIKGTYVEVKINYDLNGVASEARMLVTYVPAEKLYKSWWFDSISPSVVAQTGKLQNGTLVLESEAYPSGEVIRSTWKPTSNGMSATVASGTNGKFSTIVDSVLTKSKL